MAEKTQDIEHPAVDELLPWYVNGTLSNEERARVRRHIDECDDCRANVELLSAVNDTVCRPAATPIPPPQRPERLLAQIDHIERASLKSRRMPLVAAAAAVAVAALALAWLLSDREPGASGPSRFETATSAPHPATMDYVVDLEFEPGIGLEDRQRILRDLKAGGVSRDEGSGVYHVNISLPAASLDELEAFTNAVEALPEVRSARVVALQLPMQRRQ